MYILSLKLRSFRNYSGCELTLGPHTNVLFGGNAQGKTNLLEAMYLCSRAKSYRTSSVSDLVLRGEECAEVELCFFAEGRKQVFRMAVDKKGKKKLFLNDVPVSKVSRLLETCKVILFSPDDLLMVKKGPDLRRKFIDNSISQLKPAYLSDLVSYCRLVEQKNKLLKFIKDGRYDEDTLAAWNFKLAEYAAKITAVRKEFVGELDRVNERIHSAISGQQMHIAYLPNIRDSFLPEDYGERKQIIFRYLQDHSAQEVKLGLSLYGIHRDDFDLQVNGTDLRQFGSQGQQRSAVLSLKLSQSELIEQQTGERALILLDDIMSELDQDRRSFLLSSLGEQQVIITCTDREVYPSNGDVRYYEIKDGTCREAES